MTNEVPQTQAELGTHLQERLRFLESSSERFDAGDRAEAMELALSLRILLHDKGQSQSLLASLNLKSIKFYDTAFDYDPNNQASYAGLIAVAHVRGSEPKYIAPLDELPIKIIPQLDFNVWWEKPVFVVFIDHIPRQFTRRELILDVADQDGGAHVDPMIDKAYAELSRQNSLGWGFSTMKTECLLGNPVSVAIRQIAHEVLKSLKPGYVKKPNLKGQFIIIRGVILPKQSTLNE